MKVTTCALPLLLVLMRIPAHAATISEACVLPVGLYARRQMLEQPYSEQVREGYLSHKEAADHIKAQLGDVDQRYQALLSTLCGASSDGNKDFIRQCCADTDHHDPVAGEMCNLTRYLADERGSATLFVQDFPETPQDIGVFWNLDEISYGPQGLLVKDCGPIGPVDLSIDKLFGLASLGDRQALEKFVNLSLGAEGVYAEGLLDRIRRLFVENPRLVLDQWSIIKRFPNIQEIGVQFVDDEQTTAKRNFHELCVRPSHTCAEINRAISSTGTELRP
jgi:hypothetical protein